MSDSPSPADLGRKVHQLDNDVQSIYELLSAIEGTQRRHGNRLQELGEQVTALDAKVDGLDARLGGKLDEILRLVGGEHR